MKLPESSSQPIVKPAPIVVGSGDHTYGVVTLSDSGSLEIAGDSGRITRLLARMRRQPDYRDLDNPEFFAAIPEALCDGCIWASPPP